ncbi:MAG: PP2C family protein-serine/threonine phosphatase [Gaiella sp.]
MTHAEDRASDLLFLIADGMGGHAAGEVASACVAEALAADPRTFGSEEAVERAIVAANLALYDTMALVAGSAGMGATIAGLALSGASTVTCFNVGDSKVYRADRDVGVVQLTVDDVATQQASHYQPSLITQCLGGSNRPAELSPHVRSLTMEPTDTFLICSDGLVNAVDLSSISEILAASNSPGQAVRDLLAEATPTASDDVTVLVVAAAD